MRNPWKLTSFALVAILAAVIGGRAINSADAEPGDKMKEALGHLQQGLRALESSSADKDGYRSKAIDKTKDAIDATKKGIESFKKMK
jgi:hypothetical protein